MAEAALKYGKPVGVVKPLQLVIKIPGDVMKVPVVRLTRLSAETERRWTHSDGGVAAEVEEEEEEDEVVESSSSSASSSSSESESDVDEDEAFWHALMVKSEEILMKQVKRTAIKHQRRVQRVGTLLRRPQPAVTEELPAGVAMEPFRRPQPAGPEELPIGAAAAAMDTAVEPLRRPQPQLFSEPAAPEELPIGAAAMDTAVEPLRRQPQVHPEPAATEEVQIGAAAMDAAVEPQQQFHTEPAAAEVPTVIPAVVVAAVEDPAIVVMRQQIMHLTKELFKVKRSRSYDDTINEVVAASVCDSRKRQAERGEEPDAERRRKKMARKGAEIEVATDEEKKKKRKREEMKKKRTAALSRAAYHKKVAAAAEAAAAAAVEDDDDDDVDEAPRGIYSDISDDELQCLY